MDTPQRPSPAGRNAALLLVVVIAVAAICVAMFLGLVIFSEWDSFMAGFRAAGG